MSTTPASTFVNRSLKFTPWTMPAVDAQFIESRVHQVEEVSRIFGIPPHLLGQTEKQTSWGSGVTEQNRGLARYTLMPWTSRIEQRLSRLMGNGQLCEYDYAGLLQGSAQEELQMLIDQVGADLLTVDEARRVRNLEPAPPTTDSGGSLVDKVNACTALIRAGFDPVAALEACGLPPVEHKGLLPVTLQKEEQFEADLDVAEAAVPDEEPADA